MDKIALLLCSRHRRIRHGYTTYQCHDVIPQQPSITEYVSPSSGDIHGHNFAEQHQNRMYMPSKRSQGNKTTPPRRATFFSTIPRAGLNSRNKFLQILTHALQIDFIWRMWRATIDCYYEHLSYHSIIESHILMWVRVSISKQMWFL